MKVVGVASLLGLLCQPAGAGAITCEQVRGYVQTYGVAAVMTYVKSAGISAEEVARGRACLRRDTARHKRPIGRLTSR